MTNSENAIFIHTNFQIPRRGLSFPRSPGHEPFHCHAIRFDFTTTTAPLIFSFLPPYNRPRRRRPDERPPEMRQPREEARHGVRGGHRPVQYRDDADPAEEGGGSGCGSRLQPEHGAPEARALRLGQERRHARLLPHFVRAGSRREEGRGRPLLLVLLRVVSGRERQRVEVPPGHACEALAGVHGAEGGDSLFVVSMVSREGRG